MKRKSWLFLVMVFSLLLILPNNNVAAKMYTEPVKLTNYLHEMTFDDYREDTEWTTISSAKAFGCSSVRNGNFYGRNFDYIFNDTPMFVVHVKAKEGRHASVGVATHFGLREKNLIAGEYDKQLELVPNLTLDGINDAGVICSHNVVAMPDVEPVTGTNPNGKDLRSAADPAFWLTVHNSTYDMEKKMFRIAVQENYDETFDFYLNK